MTFGGAGLILSEVIFLPTGGLSPHVGECTRVPGQGGCRCVRAIILLLNHS